jgi:hypothetical protein
MSCRLVRERLIAKISLAYPVVGKSWLESWKPGEKL